MLCVVATCWMKFETGQTSSNNFQQVVTTRNDTQHGVQTLATCWAQQCFVLLANNVASVCTGLYYTAVITDAYNFSLYFFLATVFGNFYTTLFNLPLFAFHLFALNLEFEPNTRRELFLTWCRDAGCERSPSEQGFHSIFVEKRQLAV